MPLEFKSLSNSSTSLSRTRTQLRPWRCGLGARRGLGVLGARVPELAQPPLDRVGVAPGKLVHNKLNDYVRSPRDC